MQIVITILNLTAMAYLLLIHLALKKARKTFDKVDYTPVDKLDEQCWVRSLRELEKIQTDSTITNASMVLGALHRKGHAWISYVKDGYLISYDPTFDKVVSKKKYRG